MKTDFSIRVDITNQKQKSNLEFIESLKVFVQENSDIAMKIALNLPGNSLSANSCTIDLELVDFCKLFSDQEVIIKETNAEIAVPWMELSVSKGPITYRTKTSNSSIQTETLNKEFIRFLTKGVKNDG